MTFLDEAVRRFVRNSVEEGSMMTPGKYCAFATLLLLSGCATTMYMDQKKDPEWTFHNLGVMVLTPDKNDLDAKEDKGIIEDAMSGIGVKVSKADGEYVLLWSKWNTEGTGQSSLLLPTTTTTTGTVGGYSYSGTTTGGLQAVPYSYSYNFQKYQFELYNYNDVKKILDDSTFRPQVLWKGFCSISKSDFNKERYRFFKTCLEGIGLKREGDFHLLK